MLTYHVIAAKSSHWLRMQSSVYSHCSIGDLSNGLEDKCRVNKVRNTSSLFVSRNRQFEILFPQNFNAFFTSFKHWKSKKTYHYINTNEIPSELSRENLISSHLKITCYLHMWKYHHCYGFIINRTFQTKKLFK